MSASEWVVEFNTGLSPERLEELSAEMAEDSRVLCTNWCRAQLGTRPWSFLVHVAASSGGHASRRAEACLRRAGAAVPDDMDWMGWGLSRRSPACVQE